MPIQSSSSILIACLSPIHLVLSFPLKCYAIIFDSPIMISHLLYECYHCFLIGTSHKCQPFYLIRATLSYIRLCSVLCSIIWRCIAGCSVSPCHAVSSSYFWALYNPYFILGTMSPTVFYLFSGYYATHQCYLM